MRLYKVLSTNFDDLATREALGTLSDLYASPNVTNHDDSNETHPGEYAAKARRNLRRDMESKLAESSHHFVQALGEVDLVRLALGVFCEEEAYTERVNRNSQRCKPTSRRCMRRVQRQRVNCSLPTKLAKPFWNVLGTSEMSGTSTLRLPV